ncbi:MAG: GMP reductase, partial [Proteobacteria bacterium]|nr:GMP reductase [Pseudomonadota bacterium]
HQGSIEMQKIINETKLDFDDVLIVPQRSTLTSRSEIHLERTFQFYHSPRVWSGIPIICANMSFCGLDMARSLAKHQIIACLHKYHTVEQLKKYFIDFPENIDYTFVSIGYKKSDLAHLVELKKQLGRQPNICIDIPNGHMDVFVKYCKKVRENFTDSIIIAGNVTNTSSTQELIIYGGVDIIKCGIGGGSACTTRFMTGCGLPQLSTCLENAYVAHGLQNGYKKLGLICSDGGHKNTGDVCKALCAGSDFVMLGGYFAGSEPCEGEWEYGGDYAWINATEKTKGNFTYYGMSTHHSQEIYEDSIKSYRASEGTKITVPYKGSIDKVIQELLGGIRSCCCYIGADSIKNMSKCSQFCMVNKIHSNTNPVF